MGPLITLLPRMAASHASWRPGAFFAIDAGRDAGPNQRRGDVDPTLAKRNLTLNIDVPRAVQGDYARFHQIDRMEPTKNFIQR